NAVASMGGRIEVHSGPGQGTRVRIELSREGAGPVPVERASKSLMNPIAHPTRDGGFADLGRGTGIEETDES
ncbi:MAG: HAMP domain-containing histidine kinase, partial [Myxococcales bacterium]|nr:HAMP domain-containing histidine kinase [Myxococcales bacterium]